MVAKAVKQNVLVESDLNSDCSLYKLPYGYRNRLKNVCNIAFFLFIFYLNFYIYIFFNFSNFSIYLN